jgi:hypothetical protein
VPPIKVVSDLFVGLDITEGRSTGIPKILGEMKKNGSPPPESECDEAHSYFWGLASGAPEGEGDPSTGGRHHAGYYTSWWAR